MTTIIVTKGSGASDDPFREVERIEIDHQKLLEWFLAHLLPHTGTHYLPNTPMDAAGPPKGLNESEWAELQRMSAEAHVEYEQRLAMPLGAPKT